MRKQQALWREDISAGAQGSHNLAKVGGRAENTLSKLRKRKGGGFRVSAKHKRELYTE